MKRRTVSKEVRRPPVRRSSKNAGGKSEVRSRTKQPLVYVVGEPPLVEEFAQQCVTHNFRLVTGKKPIPRDTFVGVELTCGDLSLKRKNVETLDRALQNSSILLSSSVTVTVTEQAHWIRNPQRLVGISAFPTLLSQRLIEFATAPQTSKEVLVKAQDFFIQLEKEVSVVQDRVGMVLPRILCMIVNEAYFALQEGITSPQDVDVAMKLGTSYPFGPIEWGEKIGLRHVSAVLHALYTDLREDRYRIAPLLRQVSVAEIS
jgi:3-hydroxybutyryl-CoA dehydrogenase